jgi:N-acetylneuraminic acid mutarotase
VSLEDDVYVARGLENNIDTQANTFRQDLFRLDPHGASDQATFEQLAEAGAAIPDGLGYPCMVSDPESDALLLFGGAHYLFDLDPNFFASFHPFDTLWRYDVRTAQWTALAPAGTKPGARNGCNAEFYKGSMYVFGGANRFLQLNNELWRFDTATSTWTLLAPAGALPPARFIAATALDREEGKIYLYNGLHQTAAGFRQLGDFWVYDIAANTWEQIPVTPTPPRAKGSFSILRDNCGKKFLVYMGGNIETSTLCTGFDEKTTATSEVWAFDPEAVTWQKLDMAGEAPRLEFIVGATVENRHYVTGGWFDVPDSARICRQVWNEEVYKLTLVDVKE